jgi:hypothetical protein
MSPLEQKQDELIELLYGQVIDLSMMSKIELGDDVIEKFRTLRSEITQMKDGFYPQTLTVTFHNPEDLKKDYE